MKRLRPLEHWNRGFESHSRHGCLCAFILFLLFCVWVGPLRRAHPPPKESYWLSIRLKNWKWGEGPGGLYREVERAIVCTARRVFPPLCTRIKSDPDIVRRRYLYYTHSADKPNRVQQKKLRGFLVRKRTIPTERPPLVGEIHANFSGSRVSRGQHNESPRPLISVF
jgi:hypothetical protein